MIVRKRGFISGSPPPPRAATVNSLMMRVKILPRLASAAPFLCLIEAHLEWPDMSKTPLKSARSEVGILPQRGATGSVAGPRNRGDCARDWWSEALSENRSLPSEADQD